MAHTLLIDELAAAVFPAFRARVPFLTALSVDPGDGPLILGQTTTARVRVLPTASTYDATTGYANGAVETKNLYVDVPVTIDQHPHVTVTSKHIDRISSQRSLDAYVSDCASVLAESVAQAVFAEAVTANFSEETIATAVNTDLDTLAKIRSDMNKVEAYGDRVGIVNSDVMRYLSADPRIASRDYHGQMVGANELHAIRNVEGFATVWEWTNLPTNGLDNLSGMFFNPSAFALRAGVPADLASLHPSLAEIANAYVYTDPESGISLAFYEWAAAATAQVYTTCTLIYGVTAGSQGGAAGDLMDKAGHRLVTAA